MTVSDFVTHWLDRVWNHRDADHVRSHMAVDCEVGGLGPGERWSPEDFLGFQERFYGVIDDLHVEVVDVVEQGNKAIGIAQVSGTSNGGDIRFEFGFSVTVEDGKLVRAHNVVDFLTFFMQRGDVEPSVAETVFGSPGA